MTTPFPAEGERPPPFQAAAPSPPFQLPEGRDYQALLKGPRWGGPISALPLALDPGKKDVQGHRGAE